MRKVKQIFRRLPLFLFVVVLISSCVNGIEGKVVAVSDGDTFTLLAAGNKQYKVRLHGVDCPEKAQAYGQKAKDFTSNLIFGKEVMVEVTDKDKYGRLVGVVYVGTTILNDELLSNGYAWHYKQYSDSEWYALLEAKARLQRVGLWADPKPIPPWDFRKSKKSSPQVGSSKSVSSKPKSNSKAAEYVYVCSNGKVYHTADCSTLARCNKTLKYKQTDAKAKGYTACKQCFK